MDEPRKLSFQEAWESSTVFYLNEKLEDEIDQRAEELLKASGVSDNTQRDSLNEEKFYKFLRTDLGLDVILKDIEFSQEKFLRVVSLFRKIGRVPGGFFSEWSFDRVKNNVIRDEEFAGLIGSLLLEGQKDKELKNLIPRYYLEKLNYRELAKRSLDERKVRYKSALIGTYGGRKGYYIETIIAEQIKGLKKQKVSYEQGRSPFVDTNIDFAVPTLEDPWIIIMSSFQETTSSGQTTKARDMLSAYERIKRVNSRNREDRVFVNFVDGGGWLARKGDFERLVQQCDYFINLNNLSMLDSIILKHYPVK